METGSDTGPGALAPLSSHYYMISKFSGLIRCLFFLMDSAKTHQGLQSHHTLFGIHVDILLYSATSGRRSNGDMEPKTPRGNTNMQERIIPRALKYSYLGNHRWHIGARPYLGRSRAEINRKAKHRAIYTITTCSTFLVYPFRLINHSACAAVIFHRSNIPSVHPGKA